MPFSKHQIEQLSTPLRDDSICGVYLKLDKGAFRPLRNEFNVAQTALRKLSQNPSADEKDALQEACLSGWKTLSDSLFEQFSNKTRDIELISWFVAAQFLLDITLESAANSLEWLADLSERYWAHLNPVLPVEKLKSDDDMGKEREQTDAKVKAFFQLVGDSEESSILYAPMLQLPLVGEVTFFDFQSAERKGEISQLKSTLTTTVAQERSAIQFKMENAKRCISQLERLSALVSTHCQSVGSQSTNFGFAKSLITRVENALVHLSGIKLAPKAEAKAVEQEVAESSVSEGHQPSDMDAKQIEPIPMASEQAQTVSQHLHAGNLSELGNLNNMNRDLAFHLLREVSDYFRQSEPHSPISFLLEKAIRWGYLSLPELLQEMMSEQNGDALSTIFNAAGLNHLDQVLLPEVSTPTVGIESPQTPQATPPVSEPPSVEEHVSQTSPVDTQSKQDKKPQSSATSALSW
ncbi:ImpA family type VI secretion system protein [Vibrio aestuarianus]|uniref:Type VI secretion protein n=1 Tax=Vibrio aestuarianus TaxID=28171 RepID=A0ABM9FPI6_9VIBR|nr:type VI secretion system ImpA family N-terminal domain-containing protein [Vibrio aestuarianus]MDE1213534.1 type VI secretion system ImpA family N-terminal domain-containing protein [Vibrio aestuarianus]MDE1216697.1 type VI secretion system ImpA family N-terminal domain-containing protein [Vibrio aestuarianus]MDE1227964.1 type VI secretion system ImpA family N-terminal domain-containing protein [Vibrio aestuarianus]MDE1256439.1 type VI secretion system ImpA family N-terminal domain-containin